MNILIGKDLNERVDILNSEVNIDDLDGKDENDEQVVGNFVQIRRYFLRERKFFKYLVEFYIDLNDGNDLVYNSIDCCYRVCGVL